MQNTLHWITESVKEDWEQKKDNFFLYLKIKIGDMQARQKELTFFNLVTSKVIVMTGTKTGKNQHPDQPYSRLLSVKLAAKPIPTFHVLPSPWVTFINEQKKTC